jgi:hypothetical protein
MSGAGWISRSVGLFIAIIILLVHFLVYLSFDTLFPYVDGKRRSNLEGMLPKSKEGNLLGPEIRVEENAGQRPVKIG